MSVCLIAWGQSDGLAAVDSRAIVGQSTKVAAEAEKGQAMVQQETALPDHPGPLPRRLARRALLPLTVTLALALAGALADDLRLRHSGPHESTAAHAYVAAMVRNDPAGMWASYSAEGRTARGGDRAAFVAYMQIGTQPRQGPAYAFRLVAAVPLDAGRSLLYYQVALSPTSGASQLLVPVLIDHSGWVEAAGDDGLSFSPPPAAALVTP